MDIVKLQTNGIGNGDRQIIGSELKNLSSSDTFEAMWYKYNIVSLGCQCFPRQYTTRLLLKPKKEQGELTMPFDLCVHSIDGIILSLESNFEHYFEDLAIRKDHGEKSFYITYIPKKTDVIYINKTIGADYCHDHGLNKDQLIAKYKQRIENFKSCINSGKHIFFILAQYYGINVTLEHVKRLENALNKICKSSHSLIVVCPHSDIKYSNSGTLVLDKEYTLMNVDNNSSIDWAYENFWTTVLHENGLTPFSKITAQCTKFIDTRLKETELDARKLEVNTHSSDSYQDAAKEKLDTY